MNYLLDKMRKHIEVTWSFAKPNCSVKSFLISERFVNSLFTLEDLEC